MKLDIQIVCEKGNIRQNNEDAIRYGHLASVGITWMVVADGMGGHNAGEVASEMLVERVEKYFSKLLNFPQSDWQDSLSELLNQANNEIFEKSKTQQRLNGMGTTAVLLVICGDMLQIAWVGDSRAYLLRDKQISQLTCDHTMIQYLLDKGAITEVEANRSNTKHLLSRAIGVKARVEVDFCTEKLQSGDIVMLSSDGIHDQIEQKVLADYMDRASQGERVCDHMVKCAIDLGSRDNLTIGMVKVED